ncbi:predicted protein [Histoplasma mississippiense (nom. inval.)]|uniref:predicted protein n=1 Tax=Ajellomyces capsulatus (strain NAm1 / WU24) TaxID=2059318 RepID=UPI000157BED1|nr:predicted protein [Histoplasma mississippiense (nom. inval.)]EDN06356.1 predicted protein [Histoplasma mississippiense (nom. inval.)]
MVKGRPEGRKGPCISDSAVLLVWGAALWKGLQSQPEPPVKSVTRETERYQFPLNFSEPSGTILPVIWHRWYLW